jgi:hypothetical protein
MDVSRLTVASVNKLSHKTENVLVLFRYQNVYLYKFLSQGYSCFIQNKIIHSLCDGVHRFSLVVCTEQRLSLSLTRRIIKIMKQSILI